jgi:hypothetical protein
VLTVTEPQVWVLIGVFAAAMFGMIGIVTSSFNRNLSTVAAGLRSEIAGVRSEIGGLRETMNAKFDAVDAKFSGKFETLDRDIAVLSRHVFDADSRG